MRDKIDKVFSCLSKKDPNPKTELIYYNEFTLLISIVLSAQSTDVGVNKATSNLFKIAKSPEDILNLGLEGIKGYIKSLGLYNSKAKNIMSLSRMLLVEYNGVIPTNVEALEKLPGVGSKTARVFLNCAYNFPLIAVDTHVFRVSKRLGIAQGSSPKLVEKELNEVVPKEWKVHAHHWLILHGRYICKARKPDCLNCVINKYCDFYMENS
jgi:endonuclease-3